MYFSCRFLYAKSQRTKGGILSGNEGGMPPCLNTILRIYRMDRIVLHPVNRFILKIVFKMRERACGVLRASGVFLCGFASKKNGTQRPPYCLRISTRHFAPHRPVRGNEAACTPPFSSKPPSFCSFLGIFCSFLKNMRGIFASVQRLVAEAYRVGKRRLLPPRGCPVPRVCFFTFSIFLR